MPSGLSAQGFVTSLPLGVPATFESFQSPANAENSSKIILDSTSRDFKRGIFVNEIEQVEQIYLVYPRKVARRAALKAIENAVKRLVMNGSTADGARRWLWKKTKEYATSPAGQKHPDPALEFRPHPTTWFNQERYLDDPAEWQKPNGSRNGKHATIAADSETIARANAKIAELGGNHLRAR